MCSKKKPNKKCNKTKNRIILIVLILYFLFLLLISYYFYSLKDSLYKKYSNIINKKINKKVSSILINYKNNLNQIIESIVKSNEPKLSTSTIKLMNNISEFTSDLINNEIINSKFGKVIGDSLGIINYYCVKNKLKKKILSTIEILDFMKISNNELINDEYSQSYNSISVIYNLTNIIISINKYLEKIKI